MAPGNPANFMMHDVPVDGYAGTDMDILIYVIPGNPGLISLYEPFAMALSGLIQKSPSLSGVSARICGESLIGFGTGAKDQATDLQQTILAVEADLLSFAESRHPTRVVLVGHSVGSYILMEILRRHTEGFSPGIDIVGGIMLFPTLTHIGKSPAGWVLSPFLQLTFFASFISTLAYLLFFLVPLRLLYLLALYMGRLPPPAAETVACFLKSKRDIRQTLWLARDEMMTIQDDKWGKGVWGCGLPGDPSLYMYFGKKDPWVRNSDREKLVDDHGQDPELHGKMRAFIDEKETPHGWCIWHSDSVAAKTVSWIEEIVHRVAAERRQFLYGHHL
ncbi:hypothetical protein OQA88_8620 [Cercophora sp. LCS_1]